jgi:hypothetical protein
MSKAAANEQPQPPSNRMINLLEFVYGTSKEVIPFVSLKEARALRAIGDKSLQKKIIENQFHHYEPIYIYKVKDITLYQCKHFTNLNEFKNYLKACIENFKRDFNVDESGDTFVRVNDRLVGKDRIFRLLPWEDGDNECDYNYIDKYERVKIMMDGDDEIFHKCEILSANEDGNPFDENFYGNFPYYVKINNEVHCLSLKKIQNENHTYVETLMIELVYENDFGLKIKSFKFIGFLKEDPSSDSHFKKKASPKAKKASPKAKKASQKKKASPKKKTSPKAKKASPKPKKSSR